MRRRDIFDIDIIDIFRAALRGLFRRDDIFDIDYSRQLLDRYTAQSRSGRLGIRYWECFSRFGHFSASVVTLNTRRPRHNTHCHLVVTIYGVFLACTNGHGVLHATHEIRSRRRFATKLYTHAFRDAHTSLLRNFSSHRIYFYEISIEESGACHIFI